MYSAGTLRLFRGPNSLCFSLTYSMYSCTSLAYVFGALGALLRLAGTSSSASEPSSSTASSAESAEPPAAGAEALSSAPWSPEESRHTTSAFTDASLAGSTACSIAARACIAVAPAASAASAAAATGALDPPDVSAASAMLTAAVAIEYTLVARTEIGSGPAWGGAAEGSIFLLLLSPCCSLWLARRYEITLSRRILRAALALISSVRLFAYLAIEDSHSSMSRLNCVAFSSACASLSSDSNDCVAVCSLCTSAERVVSICLIVPQRFFSFASSFANSASVSLIFTLTFDRLAFSACNVSVVACTFCASSLILADN